MQSPEEIIANAVAELEAELITSMRENDRVASGETIDSLEISSDSNGVSLLGAEYIDALEFGRGPTSPDAPTGDPTLFERIQQWCNARGIDEKYAYPITKQIHEKGYPGKPGVLTIPLSDDNVNAKIDVAIETISDGLMNEIADLF